MVGREVRSGYRKAEADFGKTVFSVKDLVYADQFEKTRLNMFPFLLKRGRSWGSQASTGNGQSGAGGGHCGHLKAPGRPGTVKWRGPDWGLRIETPGGLSISHVSEDRMRYGSAPKLSLEDNAISKVRYHQLKSRGLIDTKKVNGFANPDTKGSSW